MVRLVGEIKTEGHPPDGKPEGYQFMLLGTPEFLDGQLVAFHLDKYDYMIHHETRGPSEIMHVSSVKR